MIVTNKLYEDTYVAKIERMLKNQMIDVRDPLEPDKWVKGLLKVAEEIDRETSRLNSQAKLQNDSIRQEQESIQARIDFAIKHGLSLESATYNGQSWVLTFKKVNNVGN